MSDERINELTVKVTAFASWADFEKSMTEHGYIPTLKRAPGRSKWAKNHTAAVIELRGLIRERGFRVFPETI